MADLHTRLEDINRRLAELPKGSLTYKKINGKPQPYLQRTIEGKSKSYYIKSENRELILHQLEERAALLEEQKRILSYLEKISSILQKNPYLDRQVSAGYQDFGRIMEEQYFYVDKTLFIREWWNKGEQVTLITRPRRFGKTLMLSMVEHFFSPIYQEEGQYFDRLQIGKEEEYRKLQGTIPVIFVTLGSAKGGSAGAAIRAIGNQIASIYAKFEFILNSDQLSEHYRTSFVEHLKRLSYLDYSQAASALRVLCEAVKDYYGIAPILLMDEYDTPLTEAYIAGCWGEVISFYRNFISETLKNNSSFCKALITGVTVIAKNSLFSDMNNVRAYSCTDDDFGDCFGFTESEVQDALQCQDIDELAGVKAYYDGFTFGKTGDMYNPWSISCYMISRKFETYWINTASNDLIGDLIRKYPLHLKREVESLMKREPVHKCIQEHVAFQYMDDNEDTFWALLLATGYIRPMNIRKTIAGTECDVEITNEETREMFRSQIMRMFPQNKRSYHEFEKALLEHRLEEMNAYLNDLTYACMSYFDGSSKPSEKAPENFYHGLVLGLLVSLRDRYHVVSNRESGLGRYDIAMIPYDHAQEAFLIEFKVRNEKKEASLEETAENALRQIEEKKYDRDLLAQGIPAGNIRKLGFAFDGKEALVVENE